MPKIPRKILSLDTETTGLDLHHGARPFLVTFSDEAGVNSWWEWDVDPLTREVQAAVEDLRAIQRLISSVAILVLQSAKFDYAGLRLLFQDHGLELRWDWGKVRDTLMAGHLLASNHPHDLTSMAIEYLSIDAQPYEDSMEAAVKEAKHKAPKDWRLAKKGLPEMPSAKDSGWKYDCWLPRQLADELKMPKDHPWRTVTSDYANSDSATTLALWQVQEQMVKERCLEKIYVERLKLLPTIAKVEWQGMTVSKSRFEELYVRLAEEADEYHQRCLRLADHEIESLPVNGCSNALKHVLFEKFKLESPKNTPKGQPSTDKYVLDHWLATLKGHSKPLLFVQSLRGYRRRKTAIAFLDSYRTYWLPTGNPDTMVIYSSLNPTGTDTLRFSSERPNEQQISKQTDVNLRYIFGPGPGREWYSMDASNIELRIPAYESGERTMIDLFERPDDPPYYGSNHLLFFDILHPDLFAKHGRDVKKVFASTWYGWTKNGDFAIQYGATASSGTADRAYHVPGAQVMIESRLAEVKQLSRRMIELANAQGYVETMPDNGVDPERGYPLLCTRSHWGGVMPTVPLAYHVQGTAMWWMSKAMVRCQEYLDEYNADRKPEYHARMVAQIHDELVFDFPKAKVSPLEVKDWKTDKFNYLRSNLPMVRRLRSLMEQGGEDIGVPTPVNVEYHPVCWAKGVGV
jgi:DNA polymerase I-like protein with 3'-5' exonuclease and polymerase domains